MSQVRKGEAISALSGGILTSSPYDPKPLENQAYQSSHEENRNHRNLENIAAKGRELEEK